MILEIDDAKTVGDLQDRFQECFPLLKMEFYHEHHWVESTHPLPSNMHLELIRNNHEPGLMEIKSTSKVHSICKELKKGFGLYVQIFRRHGMKWVATDMNDDITLGGLSELALISQEKNENIIYKTDQDELL